MIHNQEDELDKANKYLRLKNVQGRNLLVVREVYRRETVPCQSALCLAGCQSDNNEIGLLPADVTHYLVPDCQVAREYLEVLEIPQLTGIIFLQTVAHSVQHEGNRRLHNRLKNLVRDKRKASVIFHNEFQKFSYCERLRGENLASWQSRSTYKAADWFYNHLAGQIPVVMVTQDKQVIAEYGSQQVNVFVLTLQEYLDTFWKIIVPSITDLVDSITASLEARSREKDYVGYLPSDVIEAGLKTGHYIQGFLNVNKSNASQEAFVHRRRQDRQDDSDSDILVHGMSNRNRAVHGDLVVVELLPRSQWRGRSNVIRDGDTDTKDTGEDDIEENTSVMPTGRVVAISQRAWREYVATFSQDEETGLKGGKVLVIPWNYRIPKIRISTRQVEALKDHRIVVRIDSWDSDSQYPNGHFVRALGKIGELETEVAAILIENNIQMSTFSDAQMKELPLDTEEDPWTVEEEEVLKRRDLRNTHLVFSIDPKGCEDVDDTLSVRTLDNGNLELGVHIADVTHFVKPGTLTDQEGKSRSTTVYLADRRYDMLPGILSANLCSLISGVDRYAVSVIWELDSSYKPVNVWYGKTIICSSYKLFYEIAQAMADGMPTDDIVQNVPELQCLPESDVCKKVTELRAAVCRLMAVARHLKARRVRGGALELESTEVQIQLTETNSVEDLTPKEHLEVHETIAECMIFANHWVAKKIAEAFPNSALLRHHPLPREDKFENLLTCASAKNYKVHTESSKALAESLDRCDDPHDPVVNKLLRSLATMAMSNAAYFSTGTLPRDQFFHYGLALDLYTHFTSPIRRYADILVHRQLMAAVSKSTDANGLPSNKELEELSEHINHQHRASQNAQRDSQELFQYLFFKGRDPDDECCIVDAVIFQLRENGIFVLVPRYGMKGPVYLKNKEGQMAYVQAFGQLEWTGGNITKRGHTLTVNTMFGAQSYTLLDHITVKITLNNSWAHSSSVRLELIDNRPHLSLSSDNVARQQKAEIIKEVSDAAEEKRSHRSSVDLGVNFEELKKEYGQSASDHNMYNLFQSFKEMALKR
ncbi:DIS3-like exonuclease 1 [Ylistrum balloti]|uniref:DIS3-like exonuclease 1 n=1 Tax=Ylistrum balloti TaxID=509963 RepID=UPI002905C4F5|nr:DIS3-like exonuclease 1 [Ylistrum balloti]